MALLERVAALLRANVNDLIDKAEDPERMLKQIVLDMENQLLQVKTQVAIAIADQHLLEKKRAEQEMHAADWRWPRARTIWLAQRWRGRSATASSWKDSRRRPRIRSTRLTVCARRCTSWS